MTKNWAQFDARLVATDIDGTIVPYNGTVSERTNAALHNCIGSGLDVVLATGRPPRWLPPVIKATGLSTTAICANGAVVINTENFKVLAISAIPMDVANKAISILREVVPDVVCAAENPTHLRAGPGYEDLRSLGRQTEGLVPSERAVTATSSIEEMLDSVGNFKIVVASHRLTADNLLNVARAEVGHLVSVTRSVVGQAVIELGPLGVTKASALATYAEVRGIDSSSVVAFGDMPNDVEMLTWAGHGYAMAGGHPEAVAAARFIAPMADADGVAQVLEQMLANRAAT